MNIHKDAKDTSMYLTLAFCTAVVWAALAAHRYVNHQGDALFVATICTLYMGAVKNAPAGKCKRGLVIAASHAFAVACALPFYGMALTATEGLLPGPMYVIYVVLIGIGFLPMLYSAASHATRSIKILWVMGETHVT